MYFGISFDQIYSLVIYLLVIYGINFHSDVLKRYCTVN